MARQETLEAGGEEQDLDPAVLSTWGHAHTLAGRAFRTYTRSSPANHKAAKVLETRIGEGSSLGNRLTDGPSWADSYREVHLEGKIEFHLCRLLCSLFCFVSFCKRASLLHLSDLSKLMGVWFSLSSDGGRVVIRAKSPRKNFL